MSFVAPDFAAALHRFVHDYRGSRAAAIELVPDIFSFYSRLLVDPRLPKSSRTTVAAVLAYFVVPDDVLPEAELGPFGLLDDLYAAAHAYRVLRREVPHEVLVEAWEGDQSLGDAMALAYAETRAELGKKAKHVLRMAGLA